jgi:hypothetical protein
MKRSFGDMMGGQAEEMANQEVEPILYGPPMKKKKLEDQGVGDFIVKGLDSVHFKIITDIA